MAEVQRALFLRELDQVRIGYDHLSPLLRIEGCKQPTAVSGLFRACAPECRDQDEKKHEHAGDTKFRPFQLRQSEHFPSDLHQGHKLIPSTIGFFWSLGEEIDGDIP